MSKIDFTNTHEFVGHKLEVQEIASMIRCVDDNIADYLYERYYLENSGHADKLNEINKKHRVKIFIKDTDFVKDIKALYFIENELNNWQIASGGCAVMPYFININLTEDDFPVDEAAGLMKPLEKSIYLKDNSKVKDAFRHEMAHLNDMNFYDTVDIKLQAFQWRNEFINAGISDDNINYAYENKLEFIAVAAEGDFSKYSDEFKEYLIILGMPEWVFDLPIEK